MPKRNLILLIIIIGLGISLFLGFSYFQSKIIRPENETEDQGINFISQFNPFRQDIEKPIDPTGSEPIDLEPAPTGENIEMDLKKISSIPIAGFTVFSRERLKEIPVAETETVEENKATETPKGATVPPTETQNKKTVTTKPVKPPTEFAEALRYVDRATGNIYQTFVDKIEERKFSSTIIPKIYDAYFGTKGEYVVMRHLKGDGKTIETFSGVLPKEKLGEDLESNEIKSALLPNNIKDISLSPDISKIFYLLEIGDSVIGTILNFVDNKKIQIFESPFTEWLSYWPNSKIITLTTKPAGNVLGYMYKIEVDKKNFTRVLGDINGLTTLMSPNGKTVLYANNNLSLYTYSIDTKNSLLLGVRTLPEKCVWNKTSEFVYCSVPSFIEDVTYPDDWYKGEVSFSDQIWKINTKDGTAVILADPMALTEGEDIDGIKLALDSNEDYLFFVNKKDSFLWMLELP